MHPSTWFQNLKPMVPVRKEADFSVFYVGAINAAPKLRADCGNSLATEHLAAFGYTHFSRLDIRNNTGILRALSPSSKMWLYSRLFLLEIEDEKPVSLDIQELISFLVFGKDV